MKEFFLIYIKSSFLIFFWFLFAALLDELQLNIYPIDLIALSTIMGISYLALSRHNNSRRSSTRWGTVSRVYWHLAINFYAILIIADLFFTITKKIADEGAVLALLVFYAFYFSSVRLNSLDNAAALRSKKEEKEKVSQKKLAAREEKNKLVRIDKLRREIETMKGSIGLLKSKQEKVTNKKNVINNKITSLEENIRLEKLSFDRLKGKYPFLSKATVIHNR